MRPGVALLAAAALGAAACSAPPDARPISSDDVEVTTRATTSAPGQGATGDLGAGRTLVLREQADGRWVGTGEITLGDGTVLAARVVAPGPAGAISVPTVLEVTNDRGTDGPRPFDDILHRLGVVHVSVSARGTGCSGGEPTLDPAVLAADGAAVATAITDWLAPGTDRIALVGAGSSATTAVHVAALRPPSVAAVAVLALPGEPYRRRVTSGGVGVVTALDDLTAPPLAANPEPEPVVVDARVTDGDDACRRRAAERTSTLSGAAVDLLTDFRVPERHGPHDPASALARIDVPLFVAGAWHDERAGGSGADLLAAVAPTTPLDAAVTNGDHGDVTTPGILRRLDDFLERHLGTRDADDPAATDDPDETRRRRIEVLLETVTSPPDAASGNSTAVVTSEVWPPPQVSPWTLHLGGDGTLRTEPEAVDARPAYLALPDGVEATSQDDWAEPAPGTFASFVTDPVDDPVVLAGPSSVDLWVNSNLGDTDLEVVLSELRSDRTEVRIQVGHLRVSHRALDPARSEALRPVHTHLELDAAPAPDPADPATSGATAPFVLARVELPDVAHVVRSGSRLRLVVDAPGGNQQRRRFATVANGERVEIGVGVTFDSTLHLPRLDTAAVPTLAESSPGCGDLAGQPCRPIRSP